MGVVVRPGIIVHRLKAATENAPTSNCVENNQPDNVVSIRMTTG
jgi:hypothetical protein